LGAIGAPAVNAKQTIVVATGPARPPEGRQASRAIPPPAGSGAFASALRRSPASCGRHRDGGRQVSALPVTATGGRPAGALDHAHAVVTAAARAVGVAQVHFDARDLFAEAAECGTEHGFDMAHHRCVVLHVLVGADLDHDRSSLRAVARR
jgi:hypothetical protein